MLQPIKQLWTHEAWLTALKEKIQRCSERRSAFIIMCVKVRARECDTGTQPHQEQSTAGQVEPKVCSTGGVIKALRKAHRGKRGQERELIIHNVEEEELSPDAARTTHTHNHTTPLRKSSSLCSCWTESGESKYVDDLLCRGFLSEEEEGVDHIRDQKKGLHGFEHLQMDLISISTLSNRRFPPY